MALGMQARRKPVSEPKFTGYLFTYFEGRGEGELQEQLRFAISEDGINWRALNGNRPVIASDTISESGVFKLNGSDEYVLMYDLYSNGRYEFQRSKDLFSFTQKPESFTKDFYPRHGTVCSITAEEMARLREKWGGFNLTAR